MFIHGPRVWLLLPLLFCAYIAYAEGFSVIGIPLMLFLTATLGMLYYDNRFVIQEVQEDKAKAAEQKRIQETPARTTPSSADETKMAQAQLRVAWNIIAKAQREANIDQALVNMEAAPVALAKVRELDPNATIDVQLDPKRDDLTSMGHDSITAFMLYLQSKWLDIQSDTRGNLAIQTAGIDNYRSDNYMKEAKALTARSRAAIERAVNYKPDHVPYLLHLTNHCDAKKQREVIAKILSLEPYNVEALEISNRLK